jgi:hypothetical protein
LEKLERQAKRTLFLQECERLEDSDYIELEVDNIHDVSGLVEWAIRDAFALGLEIGWNWKGGNYDEKIIGGMELRKVRNRLVGGLKGALLQVPNDGRS